MKKGFVLIIVALAFVYSGFSKNDLNKKIPADDNVRIGTMENGMKYYIRKNSKPEGHAHFRLVVKTGAVYEDDDQDGLAHFTEHMCFNGTKHFPKNELLDYLQRTGIRFGADINAGTGKEATMYELPIPVKDPELVENAFLVLGDWAQNVTFEDSQIDGERGVIMSEWRQRNSFQQRLQDKWADKLYYNSKFAKRNVIGDTNIIQHFEYDVIRRFYNDWYRPDLMAVIAVGEFDVDKIEKKIKDVFGKIPPKENPRKWKIFEVPFHKNVIASVATDKEVPFDIVQITCKLPEFIESTYAGYREGLKRELYDKMFNQRITELINGKNPPFIQGGGGENNFSGDKRAYRLFAVNQGGNGVTSMNALLDEAFRVRQHGFTPTEFERAKKAVLKFYVEAAKQKHTTEHSAYVTEYMNNFLSDEPIPGIDVELELAQKMLPVITLEEVSELAKLYLKKENTVLALGMPENASMTVPPEESLVAAYMGKFDKDYEPYVDKFLREPLFSKNVKPGEIVSEKELEKIGAKELLLSNGAKVILKPTDFEENSIMFRAVSKGGVSLAENDIYYSASTSSSIVGTSGLGNFTQAELQKKLSDKTLSVQPFMSDLQEGINGRCAKSDLETMMQVAHLYFTDARKDEEAFESLMQKYRSFLANRSQNPQQAFSDSISVTVYKRHFRRQPLSVDMLDEVELAEAYEFFKERFANAGDFNFIFVGDFDMKQMEEFCKKYIGSLPGIQAKENWKDRGISSPKKSVTNRFKAGEENRSHVRIVIPGEFEWNQENRHILNSLVELYDINFTEVIREKLAGVYSPGIWVETEKYPKQRYRINIDFVTEPKRVNEIVAATIDLFEQNKNSADKDGTLKVKEAQKLERQRNLEKNVYWLNNIAFYIMNDESPEKIMDYDKCIDKLDAKTLEKAANKYFNTNNIIQIIIDPTES